MKQFVLCLVLATVALAPAMAQQKADDRSARPQAASAAPAAFSVTDMADGEVRKIDKEAKKVTIKHGEIKNLDMPPMTMVFQVKDAGLLDKVKPGDKVRFTVENTGTAFVVTAIEAAK